MKPIFAATALSLMLSTSAIASSHMAKINAYASQPTDVMASSFVGKRVYATEAQLSEGAMIKDGGETEWDDIGEINEVILGRDGQVKAVIVGVGGFLGIGERNIAVTMDQIRWVKEEGDSTDTFLVINANKELLTNAPEYKSAVVSAAGSNETTTPSTTTTTTPTDTTSEMMLTPPVVKRDGYEPAKIEELTAEKLQGARVYGPTDEAVGEVNTLIMSTDGKVEKVVIDVGGFLEMGERPIAVTFNELTVVRDSGWSDVRVYIDSTQAQLEKKPVYKAQ